MNDEGAKTTDPVRAPDTTKESSGPAGSRTQPEKTATAAPGVERKQVEYSDKPSDASKTQDKGPGTTELRPNFERPGNKKANDSERPQGQASALNPKEQVPEDPVRPELHKNMPAKTADAKLPVTPVGPKNAV
jgi:hypothetical protein